MSKHEELIKSLRASAAAMPSDAAVAVQYRAAADALEAQAREIERLRKQDNVLIMQLVDLVFKDTTKADARDLAITAGRARLEGTQ